MSLSLSLSRSVEIEGQPGPDDHRFERRERACRRARRERVSGGFWGLWTCGPGIALRFRFLVFKLSYYLQHALGTQISYNPLVEALIGVSKQLARMKLLSTAITSASSFIGTFRGGRAEGGRGLHFLKQAFLFQGLGFSLGFGV